MEGMEARQATDRNDRLAGLIKTGLAAGPETQQKLVAGLLERGDYAGAADVMAAWAEAKVRAEGAEGALALARAEAATAEAVESAPTQSAPGGSALAQAPGVPPGFKRREFGPEVGGKGKVAPVPEPVSAIEQKVITKPVPKPEPRALEPMPPVVAAALAPAVTDDPDAAGEINYRDERSLQNAKVAIAKLGIRCQFDDFHKKFVVHGHVCMKGGAVSESLDSMALMVRNEISKAFKMDVSKPLIMEALQIKCFERAFDPVRDYVDGLCWDGQGSARQMVSGLLWSRRYRVYPCSWPQGVDCCCSPRKVARMQIRLSHGHGRAAGRGQVDCAAYSRGH